MAVDPAAAPAEPRCGYVAIVGRPNVGKSTLMNRLLGCKLSITAPKPQTTRHQILGVKTVPAGQLIFIDTPGIHRRTARASDRYLNRVATAVLNDVDLIAWVVEAGRLTEEDRALGRRLAAARPPLVAAINKIDRFADKQALLPLAGELAGFDPVEVVMISARTGSGVAELERRMLKLLPLNRPYFDADELTDRSEKFIAGEFIREQLTRRLHQELPYAATVEVEGFNRDGALLRIAAVIWVEREGQKGIVIGAKGRSLKAIGQAARASLERFFDCRVHLELWVKVKQGWSDDERALESFGYR